MSRTLLQKTALTSILPLAGLGLVLSACGGSSGSSSSNGGQQSNTLTFTSWIIPASGYGPPAKTVIEAVNSGGSAQPVATVTYDENGMVTTVIINSSVPAGGQQTWSTYARRGGITNQSATSSQVVTWTP